MSWLFSQALVEAFSEENYWDGEPCAQLNVMPTQHKFWRNDKPMDASTLSRFGLTCAVLTGDRGEELLTWFREGFRAKTSAQPERVQESQASDLACGWKWYGSFAKYDHDSHSWRTHQLSLLGDFTEFSETWPRWGWMRDGECWEQTTAVPTMIVTESGLRERFPTPTVCGNYNRKGASKTSGDGLATYVRKFPTPTATAYKGWSKNHNRAKTNDRLDYTVERESHESGVPGRLNPTWEEWLMAWPIGWTELRPLEMAKFQ